MGSIKVIKTDNFKFDVVSVVDGIATVKCSALISTEKSPKYGHILFGFDEMSRNKPIEVAVADLWATVVGFEERLAQLLKLRRPAA